MTDVLFIVPPTPLPISTIFLRAISEYTPLGIGYIDSLLTKNGFKTSIKNYYLGVPNKAELENTLKDIKPKVVALTAMTEMFNNAYKIAKICKEILSKVTIVIGGPHVTFLDTKILEEYECIDIIVRNEGELTFLELMQNLINNNISLSNIQGITYRNGNAIIRNPPRALINNLDTLPFPNRYTNEESFSKHEKTIGIISSRGCPGRCIFCSAAAMSGGAYRKRSPENVIEEIESLAMKGNKRFFFMDDTITADVVRFEKICNLLKKLNLTWTCESRVDVISENEELPTLMYNAGCRSVQFGVETGSPEVLENINKGIQLDQIEKAIQYTRKTGIDVVCSIMIGHYCDTLDTSEQTLRFGEYLMKKYIVAVIYSITTPYPGTAIFKNPDKFGIKIQSENFNHYYAMNPIIDTKNLSRRQIRNLFFDGMMSATRNMPSTWKNYYMAEINKSLQYLNEKINSG